MDCRQSPLFLGLVRSPRLAGLPILYAMIWIVLSLLAIVWVQSGWIFLLSGLLYLVFYAAAQWDANFMDVLAVTSKHTRPTKNRKFWNGDSYGA